MGTPEFAVSSLDILIQNGHNIVGVITSPDRKSGRGQKVNESAVKKYAVANNLTVLQPTNLKSPEFINELSALQADLQVVVAFRMLPEIVWNMPSKGTINLHGSLLPDYRGAAPINWTVMNGNKETGVTTFFIEKEIDTGKIIQQSTISIGKNESAGELHDRMMKIGAETLLETVNAIKEGNATGIVQSEFEKSKRRKAPKIFKKDCEIDWANSVDSIHNFIRGLSPYPAAWCLLNDKTFKVYEGIPTDKKSIRAGEILTDNKTYLQIETGDFNYEIKKIQMQGKKSMLIEDFLRGYNFSKE